MSLYIHHAIIVTSHGQPFGTVYNLHTHARTLGLRPTGLADTGINACVSFAILPDGHSETFNKSDEFDEAREKFIQILKLTSPAEIQWVAVEYGNEDTGGSEILDGSHLALPEFEED